VIDLHSHILHGIDDGPADIEGSIALARAATMAGVRTIVATPHVRDDHPFPLDTIDRRVEELNVRLRAEGLDLSVVPGAEVSISKAPELDDATLGQLCLGDGPYMLVESPYTQATQLLENVVFDLQARGYRPLLAHPERSPAFQTEPVRLVAFVDRGVKCSITALSMAGGFGRRVKRYTETLFEQGLVHDVASDTHDPVRRPPDLSHGFEVLDKDLPGLAAQAEWFVMQAPAAMLRGEGLPEMPPPPPRRPGLRRRLRGRR